MAKITKSELTQLIKEEVERLQKLKALEAEKAKIEDEIKTINECAEISESEESVAEGFNAQSVLDPAVSQQINEAVDPAMGDMIAQVVNWLTGSADTMYGNIPNATALAGPALLALSGAIAAAKSFKDKIAKKAPAGPKKAPVNPASVDPAMRRR